MLVAPLPFLTAQAEEATSLEVGEYAIAEDVACELQARWLDRLAQTYPADTWAPLKWEPTDEDLTLLGLPGRDWLMSHEFPVPTAVFPNGETTAVALPAVAAYGGAGCFGIRPGAWLLLLDGGVGWCSMAHVYGSPGSYSVSTAGHCGKTGDRATVIAAFSNTGIPILLDFGKFSKSTGDGGIGKDWALISVESAYQHLVSPTMCAWGGPVGMFTKTGTTVGVDWPRQIGRTPSVTTNTDPLLPQVILHYGHGTGVGQGVGTARVGAAVDWQTAYFTWFGAITFGDSGSGSNTATGDTIGALREAAGINTHIYVDGLQLFKTGTGYLASTRATQVTATLANGQLLPYPAPVAAAP
jgi:hypothetical protein